MNLFFFGGTFDPPHLGHYLIVERCLEKCDKFVIIPNHSSVDKFKSSANPFHRLNMLKILFSKRKSIDVPNSDYLESVIKAFPSKL